MTALKVDGSGVTQPVSGTFFQATQPVSAAILPLPSGASTEATLATRLADATFTGRINTQGQKTSAASTPVVLASDQSSIPVAATLSAETSKVIGTVNVAAAQTIAVTQATAANLNATIAPPTLTKGTQGATGLSTQDLKDAGRTYVTFTALAAAGVTSEALLSFSQNKQGAVTAGVTSYVVPSGKTLRITTITISVRAGAAAVPFARCILRHNTAGATIATSPVAFLCPEVFGISATIGVGGQIAVAVPDGLEFRGDGTQTIGMSHLDQATTNILNVTICGFEY
jgi:hypothetical protein